MVSFGIVNVIGLRNPRKRQNIYHWLQKQKFEIICLQETHCDNLSENEWKQEWENISI